MSESDRVVEERKVPKAALCFQDSESVVEVSPADSENAPRFTMIANSGQPFRHWWWDQVIIDMEGLQVRKEIPILLQHDVERVVGFADTHEVRKDGLYLEGPIISDEEPGQLVLNRSKKKFPWQASVYVVPEEIQILSEDEYAEVNGMKFEGPGAIFRKNHIRESSFCVLGADENTAADAFKNNSGDEVAVKIYSQGDHLMAEKNTGQQPAKNPPAKSEGDAPKFTAESIQENAPEIVQQFKNEGEKLGREAAIKEERERVSQIFSDCRGFLSQIQNPDTFAKFADLADKALKEGTPREEALKQFADSMRTAQFASAPASPGAGPEPKFGSEDPLAGKSGKELFEAQYDNDEKVRNEFSTKESYVAYAAARERGLVR